MQIVIDIDEEVYKKVKENCLPISVCNWCVYAVQIQKGTPLLKVLDKIRAEIEEEYGYCNICEYFDDYDYEDNDISEYRYVASVKDILQIIDKYKAESEEV